MRVHLAAFALAGLLLMPAATAAINGPIPFEMTLPYGEDIGQGSTMTAVSGQVEAEVGGDSVTYGALNATGLRITGVDRACRSATDCASGSVEVTLSPGGDVALHFPVATQAHFSAVHAVSLFVDWRGNQDLEGFGLDASLVAMSSEGAVTFADIPAFTAGPVPDRDDAGVLVLLDDASVITIKSSGGTRTVQGEGAEVFFDGAPVIAPFSVSTGILPFEAGSSADFRPAGAEDTQDSLQIGHLQQELGDGGGDALDLPEGIAPLLRSVALHSLGGASAIGDLIQDGVLLRYTSLHAEPRGDEVQWTGGAPLQIEGGEVVRADPIYGLWPWWAYLLMGLAIAAFVVRMVLKVPKHHERWDALRWVGLVGGIVAGFLAFLLWDNEIHAVWGASVLRGAGGGAGLAFLSLMEFVPLLLIGIGIGWPVSSLLKSGSMLARQGTFMGVFRIVAPFVTFLLGATLVLDYTGWLLDKAGPALGG